MSNVSLLVKNYKTFDRSNGRHGQVLTVSVKEGHTVDVDCVDKEEFDFSSIKYDTTYSFEFDVVHNFRKALSKNKKEFFLNYLTIVLKSCSNDIELD